MTFLGVVSMAMGLLAMGWFTTKESNRKTVLFGAIVVAHLATTFIYYYYVQSNDADTKLYYFDPYRFFERTFSLGTVFVIYLVQYLKQLFGGTYLDYFLLFQVFGVWGIALLMRTMEEASEALGIELPPAFTLLMFIPGMYFWTSAIGKDAPLFFACALMLWATMNLAKRWMIIGLAIGVMMLFRPHIALVALGTLTIAILTGQGVSNWVRLPLVALAGLTGIFLFGTVQDSLKVDISSIGAIAGYLELQTATAAATVENVALAEQSFSLKVISLLYRPFFVDAGNAFGLVASMQNLFMVYATYILFRHRNIWRAMFRSSLPIRFATLFLGAMILLLSFMYYNVGLGLRQREMMTPALFLIFTAVYLVSRSRQTGKWGQTSPLPN